MYLLSPEARCRLYRHFVDVMWLAPLFPKHHNDVILEKIVWRRPLSGINLTGNSNFYATMVVSVDRTATK